MAFVEFDETDGSRKVVKMVLSHDAGKALNPKVIRGQLEGSAVMGVGYVFTEEFVMNDGTIVTDSLRKCGIPRIQSIPDQIDYVLVEKPDPNGPFGAKGISEAALVQTAPAITNAIYDACGVRIRSLPIKGPVKPYEDPCSLSVIARLKGFDIKGFQKGCFMRRIKSLQFCLLVLVFHLHCRRVLSAWVGKMGRPGSRVLSLWRGRAPWRHGVQCPHQVAEKGHRSENRASSWEKSRWQNVIMVLIAMVLYTLLLNTIGFVLCTFLIVVFFVKVIALQRWTSSIMMALCMSDGLLPAF